MRLTFAALWVAFIGLCVAALCVYDVKLDSDPLSLLDESAAPGSAISEMRALLRSQAGELFVLIESTDSAAVRSATKQVSAAIKESSFAEISSTSDFDMHSMHDLIGALRPELLTPDQRELLLAPDAVAKIKSRIQQKLISPLGSYYREWLSADPLLLLPEYLLQSALVKNASPFQEGLLRVHITIDPLARSNQAQISQSMEAITIAAALSSGAAVRWIGYARFADDSATRLTSELTRASIISTICVALTILAAFKTLWPIVLSLFSGAAGVLIATATAKFFYPDIHLFTLTIGAALSGVTVDYALLFFAHYYSGRESGLAVMRRIRVAIWAGVITSALAFAALALSGLKGLEQMAFFSATSLLGSFLTVYLLFPYLVRRAGPGKSSIGMHVAAGLQRGLKRMYQSHLGRTFAGVIFIGLFSGVLFLRTDNDIRSFQPVSPDLVQIEVAVASKVEPSFSGTLFHFSNLTDDAYDNLSTAVRELVQEGALSAPPFWMIVPPGTERAANRAAYGDFIAQHGDALKAALTDIGLKPEIAAGATAIADKKNLFAEIVRRFSPGGGSPSGNADVVLPMPNIVNLDRVAEAITRAVPGASMVSYSRTISELLERQMNKSIWTVALAYILIALSFLFRYGLRRGMLATGQVLAVAVVTLGTLGLLHVAIDFFSVLALVIVLGLCVDFEVFYLEAKEQPDAASVSIVTATITTAAAFLTLGVSSARVLAGFGLTISIGVVLSMLLAPAITLVERRVEKS